MTDRIERLIALQTAFVASLFMAAKVAAQSDVATQSEVAIEFEITGSGAGDNGFDGAVTSNHYKSRLPEAWETNAPPHTFAISLCEKHCDSNGTFVTILGIPLDAEPGRYAIGSDGLYGYFGHLGAYRAYNRNPQGYLEIESLDAMATGHFEFSAEENQQTAHVVGRLTGIPVPTE